MDILNEIISLLKRNFPERIQILAIEAFLMMKNSRSIKKMELL